MEKIVKTSKYFNKKILKLERKNIYSFKAFEKDLKEFFEDEKNKKFRKHKIQRGKDVIFSISLGSDLRTLYFFEKKKSEGVIEYGFFDIGNHKEVYGKNKI